MFEKTNEQINAEREADRRRAERDAADSRVIPQSGYDGRTIAHHDYMRDYLAAGGKN